MAFTPEQMAKLIDGNPARITDIDLTAITAQFEQLKLTFVNSIIFANAKVADIESKAAKQTADMRVQEAKIAELEEFRTNAFRAHPNIDLDIGAIQLDDTAIDKEIDSK